MTERPTLQCPCEGRHFRTAFTYDAPPEGEIRFPFSEGSYRREILRCGLCDHFISSHDMDMSAIYSGEYVDATYGGDLRASFERVMALPAEQSDNRGRAARVDAFARDHFGRDGLSLLDVGSGLGVFPAAMKDLGWRCTALDPDERAARHVRDVVGVDAVCGDFNELDLSALGTFDVVSFNKVLEHVLDPVAMLSRALTLRAEGGLVYVELPDGEAAADEGPGREELFIDHHHVFSAASVATLATRAGLRVLNLERLREPSTKWTLRAFLTR